MKTLRLQTESLNAKKFTLIVDLRKIDFSKNRHKLNKDCVLSSAFEILYPQIRNISILC